MDITLLIALAAVLLLIILAIVFFKSPQQKKDDEIRPRAVANRPREEGIPRRAQMNRNRGARLRANAAAAHHDSDEEVEEPAEEADQADGLDAKMGAKKRAKLEAKAEKKAQREAEENSRKDKKKREQLAEEARRKQEEQEKNEEKQRAEEEKRAREEKERKEYEEYLKMKEAFSIDAEGYEEGESEDSQNVLQEFVQYVKNHKVVVIEDLASVFKLKTQAAIDRIRDLQNDNILTGVIDDRGKFIYVSQEEMEAVAKFIRQRGRISIQELVENSNHLINLTPVAEVK